MSGEFEITIPIPNSQYGEIIVVNKYGDQFSLVAGGVSKAGQNYMKWGFPQGSDKKPREKAIPWKLNLGNRNEAIEVVKAIATAFGLEAK